MNDHDRENLKFLLSVDAKTLKSWYDNMDADDIDYAAELLTRYKEELETKTVLLSDNVGNVSEAKKFLKRFSICKK